MEMGLVAGGVALNVMQWCHPVVVGVFCLWCADGFPLLQGQLCDLGTGNYSPFHRQVLLVQQDYRRTVYPHGW